MKVLIDTEKKIIEIEEATTEELKKLCEEYKGFLFKSKIVDNWLGGRHYPVYPYVYPGEWSTITVGSGFVNHVITDTTTGDSTDFFPGNITYTT